MRPHLEQVDKERIKTLKSKKRHGILREWERNEYEYLTDTRKPKLPKNKKDIYDQAHSIMAAYLKDHTQREAASHFDTYQKLIWRLNRKAYDVVKIEQAQKIINIHKKANT